MDDKLERNLPSHACLMVSYACPYIQSALRRPS